MPKTIALVDGETERAFVQMAFPADEVRPVRCLSNGESVTLQLVSEEILENLELFGGEYDRVIILWDREHRQETATEIAQQLAVLINAGGNTRTLLFGIKDVEIENWILADEDYVRPFATPEYTYTLEGSKAKNTLSKFFIESLSPNKKAKMLLECAASRIEQKSPSFKLFRSQCAEPTWWWLHI